MSLIVALSPLSVKAATPRTLAPLTHALRPNDRGGATAAVASVYWIQKGLAVQPPHQKAGKGKKGQKLFNRYGVQTAKGQKADLSFPDTTHLRMNQQTAIVLRNPHLTQVTKGTIEQEIQPGTNHQIQTASAVATAIGTRFIEVVKQKRVTDKRTKKGKTAKTRIVVTTEVIGEEGVVDVRNQQGDVEVHAGEESIAVQGKAPTPAVTVDVRRFTTWTDNIPKPVIPPGKNVALQDNGGRVVGYSSQSPDARPAAAHPIATSASHQTSSGFAATNINDGQLNTSWSTDHGKNINQWVEVGFSGGSAYQISSIVVDPAATGSHPAANDAKDFQIWVSTSGLNDSNFTQVLSATAQQSASLQLFKLSAPVLAQYVKLVVLDNYGGDAIDVAELEIISNSNPVSSPTPVATTTPISSATSPPAATATSAATATPAATSTPVSGSNAVLTVSPDASSFLFPPLTLCQPTYIPTADSTFHVSATGLAPSMTYDLAISGSAGGVTVNLPVGTITSDAGGSVASQQFTLPPVPGHQSWTLVATPQAGGPAPSVAFTTTTGWCFVWNADANGNVTVQWEGSGWKPGGTVTLTFDGTQAYSDSGVAGADGSVGPQTFQAACVPGSTPNVSVRGPTIDDPNFTDSDNNSGRC